CAPETVPATRDSGLAPKCLAMKDTKQGAECLAFYCMKIPYDPICDTQLDPDIDAPGSKPAKTAASTKKPPPATSKKATTNPGKGPEKNVGDLKNPFASSSTKKAAPKDDTGLVKPDDAPPAAGATCASGASKCSVQYCVKHPTDVRCDVE
ncbi:MAG TPA: hypothetical protein VL326_37235, partial [Kofleriaceae bacterium]|nr:hypothetical protein [Kofleriaceae bacterium]